MIIHVHSDSTVRLEDPDSFTAFSIRAATFDTQAITDALGEGAEALDEEHVWVPIPRLHALGERYGGPDWRAGCDGMIDYAVGKGWVDETRGLVRAHVER